LRYNSRPTINKDTPHGNAKAYDKCNIVKDRQLDGRTDRQTDGIAVERIALRNGVVLCEC